MLLLCRASVPAFDLCTTEFLDEMFRVPCNPIEILQAEYGPDWRTPQEQYSYESAHNIQQNGVWDHANKRLCAF